MKTSRNKIMPRNCYVFWLKNNKNPFKNDINTFFLSKSAIYMKYIAVLIDTVLILTKKI